MSDASASEHPGKHSASFAACMGEAVHYSSHSNSAWDPQRSIMRINVAIA